MQVEARSVPRKVLLASPPSAAANCCHVFFGGVASYFGEQVNFVGDFCHRILAADTNSSLGGSERDGLMVAVPQPLRCLVIVTERPLRIEAAGRNLDSEVTLQINSKRSSV